MGNSHEFIQLGLPNKYSEANYWVLFFVISLSSDPSSDDSPDVEIFFDEESTNQEESHLCLSGLGLSEQLCIFPYTNII